MIAESKIKQGFLWLGASSAALRGLDAVGSLVVLLLLSSDAVGLASLSWAVAVLLEAVNGLGVGHSVVQAKAIERRELDSLFWFSLGVGALASALAIVGSGVIARAFGAEALGALVVVSALRLPFVAAALVPRELLNRNLEFRKLAAAQTLSAALALACKLGLALGGAGAWSLVVAHTAEGAFLLAAVAAASPFRPRLAFAWSDVGRHLRFGSRVAASVVLYHAYRNLDFFLVGRYFGVATLGAYRVAFDLVMVPVMAVVDVMGRSAFPLYSRVGAEEPARLKELYLWVVKNLALVVGPLCALFFFVGADVLVAVAGDAWAPAGPYVRLLCGAALLRALTQITPPLFHAAGRPELAAYDSLLTLVVFPLLALLLLTGAGAALGPDAVSLGWVTTYVTTLLVLRWFAGRLVALTLSEYARNLAQPLALVAVLVAAGAAVEGALSTGAPRVARVALHAAVFGLLSLATSRWVLKLRLRDLFRRRTPA